MFVQKKFTLVQIMRFSGGHIIWITAWSAFVYVLHIILHDIWVDIPFLPISILGTAVAFYLGFKNNSAYDRLWEARKIWGAIVNSSRMWGATVKGFVSNQFSDENLSEKELQQIHKKLLYRHIAWLYTLRSQLLIPTTWEHIKQPGHIGRLAEKRQREFGVGLFCDDVTKRELELFLEKKEMDKVINFQNTATQLIDNQSQDLKNLRKLGLIDDFRHMELQKILNDFYTHQGKAERIKKFPLPRQYGNMSLIFVGLFVFLLPFGFISAFHDLGETATWLAVPFSVLIAWVYVMMELIGDYSENPFEGLGNDIPMLALCRVIEIDLREMLGETDLPPKIEAKEGVLM